MIDAARLGYKPGWRFKVAGPGGRFLCVYSDTLESRGREARRLTQHQFEFPADGFTDDRDAARWVLDCILLAEQHEACEFLTLDGVAVFWPHHQDEGSPYEIVERLATP